jgi:uncharacterized protein (TIGR03437 family)
LIGLPCACLTTAWAQPAPANRLDFLKVHDSSYALFADTSATFQSGKQYPNELLLITGLPLAPVVSARVDLGLGEPRCPSGDPCGRLRGVAISPDGDTALVTSDTSDVQTPAGRAVSALVLVRNLRAFVQSRNKADLRIRVFPATDFPQLDSVGGIAFGPDGQWGVVNTRGPGPTDLTDQEAKGTIVVITGLPDNPQFSRPFAVSTHSLGNIALSLDGSTLLINDTTDRSGETLKSNQILVQGIQPGSGQPPRIIAKSTFVLPAGVTDILPPVRDAKLTLDGRFVLAPISIIAGFDQSGSAVGYNQFEILGPIRRGALDSRTLNESDGVTGGPYYSAASPDGNSALIVNGLDLGGGAMLTGLASGDVSRFAIKPLPFPFFGPAFPLGAAGPPVLAPHAAVVFTPDGKTALVENEVVPPLADTPLGPSITALTGFDTGKIQVAAHLVDPILNTFDYNQQIATAPSGLLDFVNLYIPPGDTRDSLAAMVNQAIAASGRGDPPGSVVALLAQFIRASNNLGRQGVLTSSQATTLGTLATIGIQAVTSPVMSMSAAGLVPGAVAPDSIGALRGSAISGTQLQLTIIDSRGDEYDAALFSAQAGAIDYLVPRGAATGKALAILSTREGVIGAATVEIEPVAPSLFTEADGSTPYALLQRVRADGSQSYEPVQGPVDLGPGTDQVFLLLFGTGIRGGNVGTITASIGNVEGAVVFAGPHSTLAGLDQVNVRLPRSLAGAGKVDLILRVNSWDTNTVTIRFH